MGPGLPALNCSISSHPGPGHLRGGRAGAAKQETSQNSGDCRFCSRSGGHPRSFKILNIDLHEQKNRSAQQGVQHSDITLPGWGRTRVTSSSHPIRRGIALPHHPGPISEDNSPIHSGLILSQRFHFPTAQQQQLFQLLQRTHISLPIISQLFMEHSSTYFTDPLSQPPHAPHTYPRALQPPTSIGPQAGI